MPQGWMATRIPALIFDGIVEIGCLFFLYFGNRVFILLILLESCWSERTSDCFNPEIAPLSYGQCAPTAIVICEHFGGEILKTQVNKLAGGSIRHFYNCIGGKRYDFTLNQFDIPDYWCEVKYDDTPSSIEDALTETMNDQADVMRNEFATAIKNVQTDG